MLTAQKTLKLSRFSELYDILLDKGSFLCRFHDEVDFDFIYDELRDKYSPDMGREAICPIYLFKCLILKTISDLSDQDLMDEIKVNLQYKYFLDMAPEDMPPNASTLCVFRRQRLQDNNLMQVLLGKTFEMALERGIVQRSGKDKKVHVKVIIDGTHTESANSLCRPVPKLKEMSKKLRGFIYECDASLKGILEDDKKIAGTSLLQEMAYIGRLLDYIERNIAYVLEIKKISRLFNRLRELHRDITEYYSVNPADPDARVGHKSADTEFFGYKSQIAMDEDSGLILDAQVTSGEVGDALPGQEVMERLTDNPDMCVDEMIGDTAYSGQPFLELGTKRAFSVIAPSHPQLGTGIDGRDGFTFNKDADMFCCPQGHMAISKRIAVHKKDNNRKSIIYKFDKDICSVCPLRNICINGKADYRTFSVSLLTPEQQKLLKEQKTEHFNDRRRQRYKIEQKNAHLKQSFGMAETKGKGIQMMTVQAAVAFFASNIRVIFGKTVK